MEWRTDTPKYTKEETKKVQDPSCFEAKIITATFKETGPCLVLTNKGEYKIGQYCQDFGSPYWCDYYTGEPYIVDKWCVI